MSLPPVNAAMVNLVLAKSQASSARTWLASSRVGAMTRADGLRPRRGGSAGCAPSTRTCASSTPKAKVLPDPVCEETSRSWAWQRSSSTATCTGVAAS